MPYFILGIALLIGFLLAARWYVNAPPSTLVKVLKWSAIILAAAIFLFFLIAGPKLWALWALPVLLPWFMRARAAARMAKNWSRMAGSSSGGTDGAPGHSSEIETKFLNMYLDHQSGEMNGEVRQGSFNGKTLRNLSLDDLLALLVECREDEQSVQVLTAYLDRYHGDQWREQAGSALGSAGKGEMTAEKAHEILGLEPGASEDKIKEAHHRLLSKIHPDHGGSTFLATQINQAKDFLLG
ncbi:MAG: DnaJ domain-containing protein [Rhodospirillales bacterium]|nr:DnaJ domain-containing protein [Rhodospirillales bacterium]